MDFILNVMDLLLKMRDFLLKMMGFVADGTELTLMILPLKKESLQKQIFLQERLWPSFGSDGAVLSLSPLKWLVTTHRTIS